MNVGYALDEAQTRAVLKEACEATGQLSATSARLLRLGSNAVYRLHDPVVARIARPDAGIERAQRTVEVARWLASLDYPSNRALAIDQPVIANGHAVTFWEAISADGSEYGTIAQVADVIARLHALTAPETLHLPELDPFANAADRIASSDWLTSNDRSFMEARLASLQAAYANLEFALPQGVIHGDANIGNVLRDTNGNPVVIDLDDFATGPREWDLIQTAIFYDRIGWHTQEEYEFFTSIYGHDILQWPGYETLASIREFIMVTWIAQKAIEDERTATEARKRLDALRSRASRKDWLPF